ncbi:MULTISPECIES: phosphatase PAP2 family protein [unclassified Candidatus Tisiphia]|uniref:phosphatase PAP2 family protein n=1 Tax=unclassified Candidatus Tisiphia TaxID=2996318 RepID=UPI0035C88B4B
MLDNVAKIFLSFSHDIVIIPLLILGYIWLEQKVFFNAICLILVSMLFNFALKITFQVPLSAHIGKQGFAFPSGHMQSSVVLYGWLMTKTQSRICKILITGLLFGIGMSLVYCDYHNYFDILGAIFFGSLLIAFYTFLASTKKQILPPVLLTFTTFLMLYIASIHKVEEHLYMAYYALIGVIFSENIFTKKITIINLRSKIYSNDLKNWNVKQGVSERSVDELREYANTPQFCEANSSKQKSISATILCFFMLFIVKMLFTVGYISSLPLAIRQMQWAIIGFCIPASVFIANYINHYKHSFHDRY